MNALNYKSKTASKEDIKKEWYLIDAENQVLGRLASKVAHILRGKNRVYFTPHVDCGDNIIIINAEKVKLTGNKLTEKIYYRHTGYPGGQRVNSPKEFLLKKPTTVIEKAVKGMLPKTRLGSEMYRNLHVYAGATHPHTAQQPKEIKINEIK